jgi:hypothetical protein
VIFGQPIFGQFLGQLSFPSYFMAKTIKKKKCEEKVIKYWKYKREVVQKII